MDKVTSKRIKNNVFKIEKSCNVENKNLNKRKANMNKKKNVYTNEPKSGGAIKKNLKKAKNENILKNPKDKLGSTYLINTRKGEHTKKETTFKELENDKKVNSIYDASSFKGKKIPERSSKVVKFPNYAKKFNLEESHLNIRNYFKNNKEYNDKVSKLFANKDDSNSGNVFNSGNVIHNGNCDDTTNNSNANGLNNLPNRDNYLNVKSNLEYNLLNYKNSILDSDYLQNFSTDVFKSDNLSATDANIKDEYNMYVDSNGYIINNVHPLERDKLQKEIVLVSNNNNNSNHNNNCANNNSNVQNSNALDISNKFFKNSKGFNEAYGLNNSSASMLLNKHPAYKYNEDTIDNNIMNSNKNDTTTDNITINMNDTINLDNTSNISDLIRVNKNVINKRVTNKDITDKNVNKCVLNYSNNKNSNKGVSHIANQSNELKNTGHYIYKYKERNKEYLDSINLPYNNRYHEHVNSIVDSTKNRNLIKSSKSNEELFSKNLMNFGNFCSYKFKKNINNNIINNICNMYDDENFNVFINRKKKENGDENGNNPFCNMNRSNSFFAITRDHFEGEKLFKKPKISLYNTVMNRNKSEEHSKIENKENDHMSNILLKHQDLLINKMEKIIINKDSNTKNIMKNYIKNFWSVSKKDFFGKYSNSSLHLENKEIEKLKELIPFKSNKNYTIIDIFNQETDVIDEESIIKDYITDSKLKNFSLNLIDCFLYDKQSLYEREMIENQKFFSNISFNHKDCDIKVEKLLNLFPRDFMKKYKIVKKLGEGVYGKVFNAEALDDSYLSFAVKVLRYYWPNFKYKFGSEEFAINEYSIMRILFHPNVVCLLDNFRVHTYRKGKMKNYRNQKSTNENMSTEYDFSFQRHRKANRYQYSPSCSTIERNNKYKSLISKNYVTIEDLEKMLVVNNVDRDDINDLKFTVANRNVKSLRSYSNYNNNIGNNVDGNENGNHRNHSSIACKKYIKKERGNGTFSSHLKKKMKMHNLKNGSDKNELSIVKSKSLDKLKFRKHSKKLKKIENKNNDYIENWDLFLVIEKCDCSLSDILNKVKKKHALFIQHIKQCTSQYLPSERIDMTYDHLYNYVKYIYLPLKKNENRSFYPDVPSLTETQTKVIIYQMLQGINHFHKKFIIHRDIKPANTLIKNIQYLSDGLNDSKEWIIKIADFGLGVYDHELKPETKDCNIITLQYRPPEILCNSTVYNYSVDIWSVGITMCECLLGFVPVSSKFESSVLFKILVFRGLPDYAFDGLLKKEFVGELPNFQIDRMKMLKIIFTDIYGRRVLSDDGIDLIDQFLSYDYKNRITADQALRHKWFEDVYLHLNDDLLSYYKKNNSYYF